jgi:hypothetical protein
MGEAVVVVAALAMDVDVLTHIILCSPVHRSTFLGADQMIPYIPGGIRPTQQQNPHYSNVVKQWANQNDCFSCRFNVKDWHNSAPCPCKRRGHQTGFTRSNYLEYKCANHQFFRKAMH